MHCSRKLINRRNAVGRVWTWLHASDSLQKIPPACTNRLRASQIAASMLVDSDTVDIR
jgi:hypothetical protein